jgi:FKBP-type peptidyl-prolyl cis-trans isomerase SlyD
MSKKRLPRERRRDDYQAGPGMLVLLSYELCDAEGELVEASVDEEPLELLLGYGEAPPALEHALGGLSAGERCEVKLEPKDGFGHRDPHGFIEVDAADLPPGLAAGDELVADRDGGGAVPLKVVEVLPDVVVLDTNHPLAGQRVRLRVTALSVKPASPERIALAVERLAGAKAKEDMGALLPAERLLRRRPLAARSEDDPPPHPTRVA